MWQYKTLDNELYHYGVKGMKWGVRKQEKVASDISNRYKQASGYSYTDAPVKAVQGNRSAKSIAKSKQLTDARKQLESLSDVLKEYNNSANTRHKYLLKALLENEDSAFYGMTKKELLEELDARSMKEIYDFSADWDYGPGSSVDMYLRDRGTDVDKFSKKLVDAQKNYRNECKKLADSLLGKYGKETVERKYKVDDPTISGVIADGLEEIAMEKYKLYTAWY
jgi:hypothetical protein